MRKSIFNTLILLLTMVSGYTQITGSWKGELSVQGVQLPLVFHFTEENGALTGTMDSPQQGATGIPLSSVHFENAQLKFTLSQAGISYTGTLEGSTITGEFEQGGSKTPLTLSRSVASKPGDTSLPSSKEQIDALIALDKGDYKYKVEDYFQRPKISAFSLSPGGKYIAYREKNSENKRPVYVRNLITGAISKAIDETDELVRDYFWLTDERMMFSMDKGGDENYHLYSVNIDGSNLIDLTPFDGVRAGVISILKEHPDYAIISLNKENKQVFEPYKVNVNTGALEKLFENKDPNNPIQGYTFTKDGVLKGYLVLKNGINAQYFYKAEGETEFKPIFENNWYDSHSVISFDYSSPNKDLVYMVTNLESDKSKIVLWDLKANKKVKDLYSNKDYDVSDMGLSRKRNWEIDYFSYEGDRQVVTPVSATFKKYYERVSKEFKGYDLYYVSKTDNEDKYLIYVSGDRLYGKYYIYDVPADKIELLMDMMPQLKEEDMAVMKPISFKSRDGLTIHGYITLPKAALEGKKVPLIVNPHGGPQGIRDSWGFNPETQLFASRGYATLQVNFRISGGYGKEFLRKGFKQIGRACMDDVEDGVKYVIEQGWADPDKLAIYGGSHGGYAALMGLVKTPDLYQCAVDYVGISNIETFFASFPAYWKPLTTMAKEIWYDLDDPAEKEIAKSVSPIYHIDKIKKPLYVVQGANDPRVNINESDQMVRELRAKGFEVPYMVKYNEGHGFGHEENRIELYKSMLGFFSKHLK